MRASQKRTLSKTKTLEDSDSDELKHQKTSHTLLQRVRNARKQKQLSVTLRLATQMMRSSAKAIVFSDTLPEVVGPEATCPHCGKLQTIDDVLAGASDSEYDVTTQCSECKERYATALTIRDRQEKNRVPWLCPAQTVSQYQLWMQSTEFATHNKVDYKQLCEERPDIYWNAIFYAAEMLGDSKTTDVWEILTSFFDAHGDKKYK